MKRALITLLLSHCLHLAASIYVHNKATSVSGDPQSRHTASFISDSGDEWFKVLGYDDSIAGMNMVNVGGKDRFLQLRLPGLEVVNTVTMLPEEDAQKRCFADRAGYFCANWIQTLIHFKNGSFLICGTNARQPRCQIRRSDFIFSGTEFSGVGLSPFEPTTNFSTVYSANENKVYSLILEDEVDSPIFSPSIVSYDIEGLNPLNPFASKSYVASRRHMLWPRFTTKAFDLGDKVLMFWTEKDDRGECPRRLTPYVGQFCKDDDKTASGNLGFMSFFKARLYCARYADRDMFGQRQSTQIMSHLMFDEIAAISDRFGEDNDLFYAAFNRDYRDSQGVAVCLFSVRNISETFRTSRFRSFKGQTAEQDAYVSGLPVLSPKYPTVRPTECGRSYSDEELYTLRSNKSVYFSMLDRIQMGGRGAVFLDTVFPDRFTAIAVDWNVKAASSKLYDVIFLGSDSGRFFRVVSPHMSMPYDFLAGESWLVEDFQLFAEENVTDLRIVENQKLLAVSSSMLKILPFSNCSALVSCMNCVKARDPYCSWDVASYSCVQSIHGLQDVENGDFSSCPPETTTTTSTTSSTTTTTTTTTSATTTTTKPMVTEVDLGATQVKDCPNVPSVQTHAAQCKNSDQSALIGGVVGVLAFMAGIVLGALGCWFFLRQGGPALTGSKVVKSLRCGSSGGGDESGSSDIGGDAELITNAFRSTASNGSGSHHNGVSLGTSSTTTFSSGLTPQANNSSIINTNGNNIRALYHHGTLPHPKPSVQPIPPRLPPQLSTGTLPGHGSAAKKIYV